MVSSRILILAVVSCLLAAACGRPAVGPSREPIVRVGVVLPEDGKRAVDLEIPAGDYEVSTGGSVDRLDFATLRPATVSLTASGIQVRIEGAAPLRATEATLTLGPRSPRPLARGAGISVRQLVAGRGFHWRKEIDQTLTGALEFRSCGGSLAVVNLVSLEDYLAGVITAEMGEDCPLESMKAQAVAARSWFLRRADASRHGALCDVCNDDCCQRYQGTRALSERALRAIRETRGEILVNPDGSICVTSYSKCCGGMRADPGAIWGHASRGPHPALDAPPESAAARFVPVTEDNVREWIAGSWWTETDIFCSPNAVPEEDLPGYLGRVDQPDRYFRWERRYDPQELAGILRAKAGIRNLHVVEDLRSIAREASGRITLLEVVYRDGEGQRQTHRIANPHTIRQQLSESFLYSSAFVVDREVGEDGLPGTIILRGAGWGHGVGLCQIGALGMALKGYSYRDILQHYYPRARLRKPYASSRRKASSRRRTRGSGRAPSGGARRAPWHPLGPPPRRATPARPSSRCRAGLSAARPPRSCRAAPGSGAR
ncbi:MAG: SpoIID/LytB domain-containing protein [Planctomycetes bacterium]|nr:SpoIID/LytB domain-containing protein [Planctomycetota bacterium]